MQTRSFLGLTSHFLQDIELSSINLGVYDLKERHDNVYLSKILNEACCEWGIDKNKISAVVTDSGANILKAVEVTFGKKQAFHVSRTQ